MTKPFLCFRVIRHSIGVAADGYFLESGSEFSIFGTKGTSFLGETTDLWPLQIDVALIHEAIKAPRNGATEERIIGTSGGFQKRASPAVCTPAI